MIVTKPGTHSDPPGPVDFPSLVDPDVPDVLDVPHVPGIITTSEVLATGEYVASLQEPSGAIGWPDGHTDAWDLVECAMALSVCGLTAPARRAYEWLRRNQRPDGSWPRRTVADVVTDVAAESNQVAYVAVGVWHELLVTGDDDFAGRMWPTVRRAMEFVLDLQTPRGEILWERTASGAPGQFALLTGCSSTYQSLRCGARLADYLGSPQPDWELAASRLGHVIARHPEAFEDKASFSMDWYYPVLAGPLSGAAVTERLDSRWAEFVVPGLGVRCVSDQAWVTGAETCELVMALAALDRTRALEVYGDIQHLRQADGSYWTGWQFANKAFFPAECSSWTAAAMILAADALSGTTAGSGLFTESQPEDLAISPYDPSLCGCGAVTAEGQ